MSFGEIFRQEQTQDYWNRHLIDLEAGLVYEKRWSSEALHKFISTINETIQTISLEGQGASYSYTSPESSSLTIRNLEMINAIAAQRLETDEHINTDALQDPQVLQALEKALMPKQVKVTFNKLNTETGKKEIVECEFNEIVVEEYFPEFLELSTKNTSQTLHLDSTRGPEEQEEFYSEEDFRQFFKALETERFPVCSNITTAMHVAELLNRYNIKGKHIEPILKVFRAFFIFHPELTEEELALSPEEQVKCIQAKHGKFLADQEEITQHLFNTDTANLDKWLNRQPLSVKIIFFEFIDEKNMHDTTWDIKRAVHSFSNNSQSIKDFVDHILTDSLTKEDEILLNFAYCVSNNKDIMETSQVYLRQKIHEEMQNRQVELTAFLNTIPTGATSISLIGYLQLDKESIDLINTRFPHLKDLLLIGCSTKPQEDKLELQHVENLSIKECNQWVAFPFIGKHLKSIYIERCQLLTSVLLPDNPYIKDLFIHECPVITELSKLTISGHLDIRNCFKLTDLSIINPSDISMVHIINCPLLTALPPLTVTHDCDMYGCPMVQDWSVIKFKQGCHYHIGY
ncbi:MAG: hypothetical protein P4L16_06550 [Chlamydiales bacterium]|nr:hypothetical protein [Chlamydiales bacterium]